MPDERTKTYGEMVWIEAMREAAGLVCFRCEIQPDGAFTPAFKEDGHWIHVKHSTKGKHNCRAAAIRERLALKDKS